MSCGLPVIATTNTCGPDADQQGRRVHRADPRSEAIASRLSWAIDHRDDLAAMGATAAPESASLHVGAVSSTGRECLPRLASAHIVTRRGGADRGERHVVRSGWSCAVVLLGCWSAGGVLRRSRRRRLPTCSTAKTYGARGNGTGDDAPASAALWPRRRRAARCKLPPGIYPLANPIKPAADVTLLGAGNPDGVPDAVAGGHLRQPRADRSARARPPRAGARPGVHRCRCRLSGVTILGVQDVKVDHCWFDADFWWAVFVGSSSQASASRTSSRRARAAPTTSRSTTLPTARSRTPA